MPSHKCAYFRCTNTSDTKSMFRFPTNNPSRLKVWLDNCDNMNITHLPPEKLRSKYICIEHFHQKYLRTGRGSKNNRRKRLRSDAIPTPNRVSEPRAPSCTQSPDSENSDDDSNTAKRDPFEAPLPDPKCSLCRKDITGFVFVCVQCNARACGACDAHGAHATHYVLRAPVGKSEKELNIVVDRVHKAIWSTGLVTTKPAQLELEDESEEDPDNEDAENEDFEIKTEIKQELDLLDDPLGSEECDDEMYPSTAADTPGAQMVPEEDIKSEPPDTTIQRAPSTEFSIVSSRRQSVTSLASSLDSEEDHQPPTKKKKQLRTYHSTRSPKNVATVARSETKTPDETVSDSNKSRGMSRVRSRSRSITPMRTEGDTEAGRSNFAAHSRRCLIMSKASGTTTDPFLEPEPKLWKPTLQAYNVDQTTGGSLKINTQAIDLMRTPQGSLRRKKELEQSIHIATLERAADMAIDEEEADDHLDHVRRWLDSTRAPPESPELIPSCSKVLEENVDTSLVPKHSMPGTRDKTEEGSELDSDFDDEFNLDELAATLGQERNIPDEQELDEDQLRFLNGVTDAIDEAVEELTTVSTDFVWDPDFTRLKSVPEIFTGPSPGPVNDYNTPLEAFESIWDHSIMELIVKETNRYASQKIADLKQNKSFKPSSRLHRWTDTCVDEMYLFFGIYVLISLEPRTSQHEYWKTTGFLEMPKFRSLMSYNRFILLGKFLHFVDNSDFNLNSPQNEQAIPAKLRKIAPIIQHLNTKFSSLYHLHPFIAINESLTLFKGRLTWVQAIRTKAARFGIKSYELCDSRTGYLYKFEIYTGKNSEHDIVAASAAQVVLDLIKGLEHRGHCVTMDNFYNCPALARYLKGSLGFDCLGTLRPNRKHVPAEIAKAPKNVAKGTIIARHSGDVSCIAWKDTKLVCMISTYHNAETYVGRKAGKKLTKPIVVRDYNNTMGGGDLKDQKLSMYLVERKRCVKWYAKLFKRLINCSVLNAFIMHTGSLKRRNMPVLTHRDFREQLANCLVSKFHSSIKTISRPVGEMTRLKRDILHVPVLLGVKNRALCLICNRNGTAKKVQLKCDTCDEFLCPGECWTDWHSLQNLPGREIKVRKGARRY